MCYVGQDWQGEDIVTCHSLCLFVCRVASDAKSAWLFHQVPRKSPKNGNFASGRSDCVMVSRCVVSWSSRGRLLLVVSCVPCRVRSESSVEWFGGGCGGDGVAKSSGCVVGGELFGSEGHVMVIVAACSWYGVESRDRRRNLLLRC